MALIEARELCVRYEGVPAVEHVNLKVKKGEYVVVLGENGSGKTTLMKALLGLVKPRSGSISFGDGLKRNRIGYLPQQTAAQRDFPASVREVVLSGCVGRMGLRPFHNRADGERACRAMERLDVLPLQKDSYRNLSGGQQQRVLLARALCATDQLLLLDEPVSSLDPDAASEMYGVIRALNKEKGVAVVMISHDVESALADADSVLVMEKCPIYAGDVKGYREFMERRRQNG